MSVPFPDRNRPARRCEWVGMRSSWLFARGRPAAAAITRKQRLPFVFAGNYRRYLPLVSCGSAQAGAPCVLRSERKENIATSNKAEQRQPRSPIGEDPHWKHAKFGSAVCSDGGGRCSENRRSAFSK